MTATEPDDPLVLEIRGLREDVQHLAETNRWRRVGRFALAGGMVISLAAVVAFSFILEQQRTQNRCLRVVVAATADRTGLLAPLAQARSKADRALARAQAAVIIAAVPKPPAKFNEAVFELAANTFRDAKAADDVANDVYDQAYAANPPPPSPSDAC